MKKITPVIIAIIAFIIIGGGAFYGGIKYAESKKPNGSGFGNFSSQDGSGFGNVAGNIRGRTNITSGEILSKDSQSITVKLRDSGSKIIFFSDSTQIMKATAGAADDLKTGENITATGTANSDGSITAQNIQIRPQTTTPQPSNQ